MQQSVLGGSYCHDCCFGVNATGTLAAVLRFSWAKQFNMPLFSDLKAKTSADLENIDTRPARVLPDPSFISSPIEGLLGMLFRALRML